MPASKGFNGPGTYRVTSPIGLTLYQSTSRQSFGYGNVHQNWDVEVLRDAGDGWFEVRANIEWFKWENPPSGIPQQRRDNPTKFGYVAGYLCGSCSGNPTGPGPWLIKVSQDPVPAPAPYVPHYRVPVSRAVTVNSGFPLRSLTRISGTDPVIGQVTRAPYRIRFVTDLFRGPEDTADSEALIQDALIFLTRVDMRYLRAHPATPGIYPSGVRYLEEPPGEEDWRDIPTCIQEGNGDCEDLACWRAAEVNVKYGIPAYPIFTHRTLPNGNIFYHIRVKYPNGHIEDPSRVLGMSGPRHPLPYGSVIGTFSNILKNMGQGF